MPRSFLITNKRYRSEDNSTSPSSESSVLPQAVAGAGTLPAGTVAGTLPAGTVHPGTAAAYYVPSEFPYRVVTTPVYPEEHREDEEVDFSSSDAMSRGEI